MQRLVFEKSISRDWGIIYAEVWHRVFTYEFKQQFNWQYTEVVFQGEKNVVTVYRAPSEHIDEMRRLILKKIDKNPKWFKEQCRIVERQVDFAEKMLKAIQTKPLTEYSHEELAQKFARFIDQNIKFGPAFIMMLWFPIQMENHPEAEKYEKYIEQAITTRQQIEHIGPLVDLLSRQVAQLCARGSKVPVELSRYISYNEAINYLQSDEEINEIELKKRKEHFLITSEGIIFEKVNEYLNRRGFDLTELIFGKFSEIKGRSAFKGKVKGTVKIINSKDEFAKFHQGDILVTSMTTPDFIQLIKKSAAFVTDEGGVTCHAAIAARELQKPCIIGTKIATKALKDGDVVEVDADNGIVRKIIS